jgi:hypothetical protein
MKPQLSLLYQELLKFPNSPKSYRELRDYYAKEGKVTEAQAFSQLLKTRFNEIPDLHDYHPDPDQKQ